MPQGLANLEAEIAEFGKVFGGIAPEFTTPLNWGQKKVPLKLVKLGKDYGFGETRGVFEARDEEAGVVVRVDYSDTYGLNLRRQVSLHEESGSLISGEVSHRQGELEVRLSTTYSSIFLLYPTLIEKQLSNAHDFNAGISIVRADDLKDVPPLAFMEYSRSQRIPLHAEFPYASYADARAGAYEIRRDRFNPNMPHFRTTYFQWESLVGAKVGMTSFRNADDTYFDYKRWVTALNNSQWTSLEGTPYASKITHSKDQGEWGKGRLRFHRKDTQTGELWMFSVPEWLNKEEFIRDFITQPLSDFHAEYPVIFWVKQTGQERQGLVEYAGKYDHGR